MRGKFSVDIAFDFCGTMCRCYRHYIFLVHSSLAPHARKKMNAQQPGKDAVATDNEPDQFGGCLTENTKNNPTKYTKCYYNYSILRLFHYLPYVPYFMSV